MSTIEGGMVCTNDEKIYETVRMLRSHGMVREVISDSVKQEYIDSNPDLNLISYSHFRHITYEALRSELS